MPCLLPGHRSCTIVAAGDPAVLMPAELMDFWVHRPCEPAPGVRHHRLPACSYDNCGGGGGDQPLAAAVHAGQRGPADRAAAGLHAGPDSVVHLPVFAPHQPGAAWRLDLPLLGCVKHGGGGPWRSQQRVLRLRRHIPHPHPACPSFSLLAPAPRSHGGPVLLLLPAGDRAGGAADHQRGAWRGRWGWAERCTGAGVLLLPALGTNRSLLHCVHTIAALPCRAALCPAGGAGADAVCLPRHVQRRGLLVHGAHGGWQWGGVAGWGRAAGQACCRRCRQVQCWPRPCPGVAGGAIGRSAGLCPALRLWLHLSGLSCLCCPARPCSSGAACWP